MSDLVYDEQASIQESWLDYKCSPWTMSSQHAADLYRSGVKLWRKEDLVDIERQLVRAADTEKFTLRRLDGSIIHVKNPMFGISDLIWYIPGRCSHYSERAISINI